MTFNDFATDLDNVGLYDVRDSFLEWKMENGYRLNDEIPDNIPDIFNIELLIKQHEKERL